MHAYTIPLERPRRIELAIYEGSFFIFFLLVNLIVGIRVFKR